MTKRQPKGIPVGGQFAESEHEEAAQPLGYGQFRLPNGWVSTKATHGGDKSRFDRVVVNPDGTAVYRIETRKGGPYNGDVYCEVTETSTGKSARFRALLPVGDGMDDLDPSRIVRIHQAPPLGSDVTDNSALWEEYEGDQPFVSELVADSLKRSPTARLERPIRAQDILAGDCIDFQSVYDDRDTYPDASGQDSSMYRQAEREAFIVEDVEHRPDGVIVSTNVTNWYFPSDYKVSVIGVDNSYKSDDAFRFPGEDF